MNVAIVNDSKIAAEVLRRILAELPEFHLLSTAYSREEAVRLAATSRPDIILMDLIMPGIDGAETTRRIMQSTPCVILVVTATTVGNRDHVFEAMGHGALDAVNTPRLGPDGDMSGAEPLRQKLRTVARLVDPQGAPHRAESAPSNPAQFDLGRSGLLQPIPSQNSSESQLNCKALPAYLLWPLVLPPEAHRRLHRSFRSCPQIFPRRSWWRSMLTNSSLPVSPAGCNTTPHCLSVSRETASH